MKKKKDHSLTRRETLKMMGAASVLGISELPSLLPSVTKVSAAIRPEDIVRQVIAPALRTAAPVKMLRQVSEMSCVARPALTEGPFFVDERLNRSDIRSDPSNNSVKAGTKLTIKFNVFRTSSTTCTPLVGAWVDLWHCDATGGYSDVSGAGNPNNIGQKFLRGYQITDANGAVEFTTIYPGWYAGRTVHLHYKVRLFNGTTRTYEFTSQLCFDDTLTDTVFVQSPYSARPNRTTRNSNDNIYQSGGSTLLLAVTSDGAGGYTTTYDLALTGLPATTTAATTVSGASYASGGSLSSEAIASIFGNGLASTTTPATTTPLPTTLSETTVTVRDAASTTRNAQLFYSSPIQVNALIPTGTVNGAATVTVLQSGTSVATGTVTVASVSPGLFSANANAAGVAAGYIQRVKADNSQVIEPIFQYDSATQKNVAMPINMGAATDKVFLVIFGTGIRNRTALSAVVCDIGGTSVTVEYAGTQGTQFVGLDQINLLLPSTLAGKGGQNINLRVDAILANVVTVTFA